MPATKSTPKRRASRKRYEPISELIGNFDGKVDVESKLVTEVALLGAKSRNGRVYTEQALQQAAGCLEGAKVFINHREPAGNSRSFRPHDVRDYVGRVQGVYVDESDMVRARRFVVHNQEHWPLVEVAKSDPSAFGFSIDGLAQVKAGEVLSVKEIASVDLVAQPATVSGLFEHSGDNDMESRTSPKPSCVKLEVTSSMRSRNRSAPSSKNRKSKSPRCKSNSTSCVKRLATGKSTRS